MAFVSLTAASVAAGEPVTTGFGDLVRTDLDDLDSRTTAIEAQGSTLIPTEFEVRGQASAGDEVDIFIFPFDATITAARIFLIQSGSSGTLTVDLELSTNGGGSFSSIFSTLPSAVSGDGNYFRSINQVFLSSPSEADTGDFLRLNIDSVITGCEFFKVLIEIEVRT